MFAPKDEPSKEPIVIPELKKTMTPRFVKSFSTEELEAIHLANIMSVQPLKAPPITRFRVEVKSGKLNLKWWMRCSIIKK